VTLKFGLKFGLKLNPLQLSLKHDVNKIANSLYFRRSCHCSRGRR